MRDADDSWLLGGRGVSAGSGEEGENMGSAPRPLLLGYPVCVMAVVFLIKVLDEVVLPDERWERQIVSPYKQEDPGVAYVLRVQSDLGSALQT